MHYVLLLPAAAGLVLLREPLKATMAAGILLLAISLWMTNHRKDTGGEKITLKWVACVTLAFAGNGLCSTVQKLAPHCIDGALKRSIY